MININQCQTVGRQRNDTDCCPKVDGATVVVDMENGESISLNFLDQTQTKGSQQHKAPYLIRIHSVVNNFRSVVFNGREFNASDLIALLNNKIIRFIKLTHAITANATTVAVHIVAYKRRGSFILEINFSIYRNLVDDTPQPNGNWLGSTEWQRFRKTQRSSNSSEKGQRLMTNYESIRKIRTQIDVDK